MVTKRGLGIAYLVGVGLGLFALLLAYVPLRIDPGVDTYLGSLTAALLAVAYVFVGYWLHRVDIGAGSVFRIAKLSAVGLSIPVAFGLVLAVAGTDLALEFTLRDLTINLIAVGGVLGLLVGMSLHIREEHDELNQVNSINRVFNRVLRHNLRNDMAVVLARVEALEADAVDDETAAYDAIKQKISEVVETSSAVRHVDRLGEDDEGPVDVAGLVERRVETVRAAFPGARFEVDVPERAWAAVGASFDSVVDNVVENAVTHAESSSPMVEITVSRNGGPDGRVTVVVADDGPGIPPEAIAALDDPSATPREDGSGLGLWLVKRIVGHYGGSVSFESRPGGGTIVEIDVPAAAHEEAAAGARLA